MISRTLVPMPIAEKQLKERAKRATLSIGAVDRCWSLYKRRRLLRSYRARRDHYSAQADRLGLLYDEPGIVTGIRNRLRERHYSPSVRQMGDLHTFAFVPAIGWHEALLPDLQQLGTVTRFDYREAGYRWEDFASLTAHGLDQRRRMNEEFVSAFISAHRRRPIDWLFVYASGTELSASSIERITLETGVPTVIMCLDDKQSWSGPWMGDHLGGQIALAPVFDLSWTSARVACEWYLVEGGRPLYMPEGCNISAASPDELPMQDLDVSFIGARYGFRSRTIDAIRRHGINVSTFGPGWPNGDAWGRDQLQVIRRSRINLGLGGIHHSEELTNVKTRDFEVPAIGRGVYLTSFNADLAQHFDIGTEILCYRGHDELIELARYYLQHGYEAQKIADRGLQRCLREHRWLHRYLRILDVLGIVPNERFTSSSERAN